LVDYIIPLTLKDEHIVHIKKSVQEYYTENNIADILGISKRNVQSRRDDLFTQKNKKNLIHISELSHYPIFKKMMQSNWDREFKTKPKKKYNLIELFAGAGGLALGFKKAGLNSILLNDFDKDCCET